MGENGDGSAARIDAYADASAGMWLMIAAGTGALLAVLFGFSGNGIPEPVWSTVHAVFALPLAHVFVPMLMPAALLFGAYGMVARLEGRLKVRRQRGALALLAFGAILLAPPLAGVFSGMYGAALLALSIRIRETLTVATGVMALAASVSVSVLERGWVGACILVLTAAACFTAAWRVGKGLRSLGAYGVVPAIGGP